MAKPNYSFEKRQRELAKKKKKEEKANRKASQPGAPTEGEGQAAVDAGIDRAAPAPAGGGSAS